MPRGKGKTTRSAAVAPMPADHSCDACQIGKSLFETRLTCMKQFRDDPLDKFYTWVQESIVAIKESLITPDIQLCPITPSVKREMTARRQPVRDCQSPPSGHASPDLAPRESKRPPLSTVRFESRESPVKRRASPSLARGSGATSSKRPAPPIPELPSPPLQVNRNLAFSTTAPQTNHTPGQRALRPSTHQSRTPAAKRPAPPTLNSDAHESPIKRPAPPTVNAVSRDVPNKRAPATPVRPITPPPRRPPSPPPSRAGSPPPRRPPSPPAACGGEVSSTTPESPAAVKSPLQPRVLRTSAEKKVSSVMNATMKRIRSEEEVTNTEVKQASTPKRRCVDTTHTPQQSSTVIGPRNCKAVNGGYAFYKFATVGGSGGRPNHRSCLPNSASTTTTSSGLFTFTKKVTPRKALLEEKELQRLEELQAKDKNKEERLRQQALNKQKKREEDRHKREERQRLAAQKREQQAVEMAEKLHRQESTKDPRAALETTRSKRLEQQKLREKRLAEVEAKRQREEQDRRQKKQDQLERDRIEAELQQRKRDEEDKEKLRMRQERLEEERRLEQEKEDRLKEEKRLQEQRLREQLEAERKERELKEAEQRRQEQERRKKMEKEEQRRKQLEELKRQEEAKVALEQAKRVKEEQKQLEEEKRKKKIEEERAKREEELKRQEEAKVALEQAKRMKEEQKQLEEEKRKMKIEEERAKREEELRRRKDETEKLQLEKIEKERREAAEEQKRLKKEEKTHPSTQLTSYEITPARPKVKSNNPNNYDISDLTEEDTTDDESEPKKPIPEWARGSAFRAAVKEQFYNPERRHTIFTRGLRLPDLNQLFPNPSKRKKRFNVRTSSANWSSPPQKPSQDGNK